MVVASGPNNPPSDSGDKILLDVRADGNVEIPVGTLSFGNTAAQLSMLVHYELRDWSADQHALLSAANADFAWYVGGSYDPGQDNPGGGGTLAMKLDPSGALTIPTGSINFGAQTRQMINLWNANYGIGVQPSTLFFRSDSDFCWYRGGTYVNGRDNPGGGVTSMTLDANSTLTLTGNLNVFGSQNIFAVRQFTQVVTNAAQNTPGSWSIGYAGVFSVVYSAFAVFQGFSIWANDTQFNNHPHGATTADDIPQHAFVRVEGFDANGAHGVAYCSESKASNEGDNCILFTLVVLGRPLI